MFFELCRWDHPWSGLSFRNAGLHYVCCKSHSYKPTQQVTTIVDVALMQSFVHLSNAQYLRHQHHCYTPWAPVKQYDYICTKASSVPTCAASSKYDSVSGHVTSRAEAAFIPLLALENGTVGLCISSAGLASSCAASTVSAQSTVLKPAARGFLLGLTKQEQHLSAL